MRSTELRAPSCELSCKLSLQWYIAEPDYFLLKNSRASTVFPSGSAAGPLGKSGTFTQSEPMADLTHSISRQSLDRALSMTQSRRSRPSQRPISAMGSDLLLSLNTLKLFEAASSLQDPMQAQGQGKSSLLRPVLQDPQEEILIEVMGDSSLSGSPCNLEFKASV